MHFINLDLQSYALRMIVSHIIDPNCSGAVKNISRNLLDQVSLPIVIADNLGTIITANDSFVNMFSFSLKNPQTLCFGDIDLTDTNLNKLLDYGLPITGHRDNLIVRNKSFPVIVNVYPIFDVEKRRVGSVCSLEDVTSNVNYTQLLKRSELVLSAVDNGVVILDNSLNVTLVNKTLEDLFNLDQCDLLGKPFAHLMKRFSGEPDCISSPLAEQRELKGCEQTFLLTDKNFYFICDTYLLNNDLNEAIGTLIILKNITSIREMELQLINSEKLMTIGQLAAGTAHEIRNPLTSIKGFVQLVEQKLNELQIKDLAPYIETILTEINRLNKITTEFLDFAKPQKAKVELVNINELISEVMFLVEHEALRKEINIAKILDEPSPSVRGDRHQLTQVFLNIANNAFQSIPAQGSFTIKTYQIPESSRLSIDFIDNGNGIPNEVLSKIFNPFFTTKDDGTGMGLAVSNRIIQTHQGEIKVSSKAGKGTVFSVILPICSLSAVPEIIKK